MISATSGLQTGFWANSVELVSSINETKSALKIKDLLNAIYEFSRWLGVVILYLAMLRNKTIGFLCMILFLGSCMDEPPRMVEYRVSCIECKVVHLDKDGVSRTDTVANGYLSRSEREVGDKIELSASSLANDTSLYVKIMVDLSVYKKENGSGDPQSASIKEEVPKRDN